MADFSDYRISINKGFRYIFVIIDSFSKYLWPIALKIKNSQTITQELSEMLTTSKRSPDKLESDRRAEFYNSIFQIFLKSKNIQNYSQFTDKGSSVAEKVIRIIRNFVKKPVFLAGKASWINGLPSVIKKYSITIHSSKKLTSLQASKKVSEKEVDSNLQDRRVRQQPKFKLVQLIRAADIKKGFSKGDSTNWFYNLYTLTEVVLIPSLLIELTI